MRLLSSIAIGFNVFLISEVFVFLPYYNYKEKKKQNLDGTEKKIANIFFNLSSFLTLC